MADEIEASLLGGPLLLNKLKIGARKKPLRPRFRSATILEWESEESSL
jgi:hypothetical protein